jgi:hypothetical protein
MYSQYYQSQLSSTTSYYAAFLLYTHIETENERRVSEMRAFSSILQITFSFFLRSALSSFFCSVPFSSTSMSTFFFDFFPSVYFFFEKWMPSYPWLFHWFSHLGSHNCLTLQPDWLTVCGVISDKELSIMRKRISFMSMNIIPAKRWDLKIKWATKLLTRRKRRNKKNKKNEKKINLKKKIPFLSLLF